MKYYSLQHSSPAVDFKEATIRGIAPDKGLYFPSFIPTLDHSFIEGIKHFSKAEIGYRVMKPYIGDTIPDEILYRIVAETVAFDFPLIKISEDTFALELFHGPTLAFKDVGARFMSRCMGYFSANSRKKITVLVATSGDTGGAVANGFLGVEGVEVIILYPEGKVSEVQELQLTTCGQNITALKVAGSFDDCQAIVKQAFLDTDLQQKLQLTSANSINVARWLPQQLYYFYAYQQWVADALPVISVPSGNFGNICAGILAMQTGLPVQHFIAACNSNRTVPDFLATGKYEAYKAVSTISNAMDVGDPSNFVRILEMFQQQLPSLKNKLTAYSITEDETKHSIKKVFEQFGYILDPHGAVGYCALKKYQQANNQSQGFFLETAHPVKFPDTVEEQIGKVLEMPESALALFNKEKISVSIPAGFEAVKEWLMHH